jgi:hypothetical protein
VDAKALLTNAQPAQAEEATIPAVVAPLPPRRPAEIAAVVAALTMPLPPPRPVSLAALDGGMAHAPDSDGARQGAKAAAAEPVRAALLVAPNADAKAQLRALFAAVSAGPVAAPAGRQVPVRLTAARVRAVEPDAVVTAAPDRVSTRFTTRSPGDDLTATKFSGSAAVAVPSAR